jgi:pimeloyl-ACP methyl ester carboxylesterase
VPEVRVATGMDLYYEEIGAPEAPPLLLVMGLGAQLLTWPEDFCRALAERGFRVIRYDNRDVGLSTWLDDLGLPDLAGIAAGSASAAYSLAEMVEDASGLLAALEIPAAHVVGASMGGMIAQLLAVAHPEQVLSLCSLMSFCEGFRESAPPTAEVMATLLTPPPVEREAFLEHMVAVNRVNWGPSFDEARARATLARSYDRAFHPAGTARHAAAVWATPNWRSRLAEVRCPALVMHGLEDPLVPVENGRRTHAALPAGAELVLIEGMGHDLPPFAHERMADAIAANAARAKVTA